VSSSSQIVWLAAGIKHCEVCKKTLIGLLADNTTGPKYIALIITKGKHQIEAHFFCTARCLMKYLQKIMKDIERAESIII